MKALNIAIIGAGKFGRALDKILAEYGPEHTVFLIAKSPDGENIANPTRLLECDVIIPVVPISKFQRVIHQISPYLRQGSTVVDVCTVKAYPARVMKTILPAHVNIIASHPMFGPETLEKTGWKLQGLPLVIYPIRIAEELFQQIKMKISEIGLKVLEISPDDHDKIMAKSQFISLFMGSLFKQMSLTSGDLNTLAYSRLLEVKDITGDDYNILKDVFRYNPYCKETLKTLEATLREITDDLRSTSDGESSGKSDP